MSGQEPEVRAATYVATEGDPLLRRAAWVLAGRAPLGDLLGALGTPGSPDACGTLSQVRGAIGLLGDLGVRDGAFLEQACRWLQDSQCPDGSWAAAVFDTGLLTGLLARVPCAPRPMLDAAGGWLDARFAPEKVKGHWEPLAGYATAFANLPDEETDGALQWCGRELERGYRSGEFSAVRTARVLLWCDAPSLPGGRVSAAELLPALRAAQAPDGSFADGAGEASPEITWDALVALLRFPA